MQQLETNLPSAQERLPATLLEKATVAHLGGGFTESATVKHGSRFLDLTGQRFTRLLALRLNPVKTSCGMNRWDCECDCGNLLTVSIGNLRNGHTKSCGCLAAEVTARRNSTHGHTRNGFKTRVYNIWTSMKQRCGDPNAINYDRYGGCGIRVCELWRNSFVQFLSDMGPCPDGCSIDRINNKGDYEPSNCRWATDFEQRTNRSDNLRLAFNGQTLCAVEWDIKMGFPKGTVRGRIHKKWSVERALTQSVRGRR